MESAGHLRENSDAYFDRAKAAMSWWDSLQPKPTQKGDRAALSKLRRAMPLEAMAQESTVRLFYRLGYSAEERSRLPRVATLACVLAHVREHDQTVKFANAVGRKTVEDKDSALLKPLRFQRLLAAESEDEIARSFRRAVAMLNGRANVYELAKLILNFDFEEVKRRFVFEYYGAGIAAPSSPSTSD